MRVEHKSYVCKNNNNIHMYILKKKKIYMKKLLLQKS